MVTNWHKNCGYCSPTKQVFRITATIPNTKFTGDINRNFYIEENFMVAKLKKDLW